MSNDLKTEIQLIKQLIEIIKENSTDIIIIEALLDRVAVKINEIENLAEELTKENSVSETLKQIGEKTLYPDTFDGRPNPGSAMVDNPNHWPLRDSPNIDWTTIKQYNTGIKDTCLFDAYVKNNPDYSGGPLAISCPCPKCTPRC